MKTLLTAIAVIAIANLLALLGFAGWLFGTGRIDSARLEKVREMFSETTSAQQAREAAEAAKADADRKAAEQARKDARPPMTATEQLAARVEATEIDRQRAERLRREISDLQKSLAERDAALEKSRADFIRQRDEFLQMRAEIVATEASDQFKKTLTVLEGLKPDQAKTTLKEIMTADAAKGVDQVVAYLNAMEERPRTKVIAEFIKEDPKVAADLLERLRTRGTQVSPPTESLASGQAADIK
ncbi:MAG: hypothetical protein AMXMBFR58_09860 [Phycisphaerae bacterium]|nr:ELKS/Rab6-interacting/CAST family protein [Phycisphaerales bacterium]